MAKLVCHITQPNSSVLEVEIDSKADGQVCLDKVCEMLGMLTIEADYFGLQYAGEKGEQLWLNMRNRMSLQLCGPQPYRLRLRVKFFVQPHFIQQEQVRHMFYQQMKQEFLDDALRLSDPLKIAEIAGHVAQAELGDSNSCPSMALRYRAVLPAGYREMEHGDLIAHVADMHARLAGTPQASVEYRTLQLMSQLEWYGVEYHQAWDPAGHRLHVGVGPEGISVYDAEWTPHRSITYPSIQTATNERRCVYLDVLNDDATITQIVFKLVSQKAANGLYRSVTEMHSFYRCDTVRNSVVSQFSRDLKGTLASLFNENTTLGKSYVFDIRRTCREVYDHARRVLFVSGQQRAVSPSEACHEDMETEHDTSHDTPGAGGECEDLKHKLQSIQDSLLCCACMDAAINTTFIPCGHVACCGDCARRLDNCPLCRSPITQSHTIYLPELIQKSTNLSQAHLMCDASDVDFQEARFPCDTAQPSAGSDLNFVETHFRGDTALSAGSDTMEEEEGLLGAAAAF